LCIAVLPLLLVAAVFTPLNAGTTALNFEGFSDSTILTTQYSGVTFSGAIVLTAGITLNEFEFPPHSGTNVASDNGGPMTVSFASSVQSFSGYFTYGHSLTLQAFDASNTPVASATSRFSNNEALSGSTGSSPNEFLQVSFAGGISKVTITGDPAGGSFTLDDAAAATAAGATPAAVSVSPFAGAATNQTFTFNFSDSAGWQNLAVTNILVNNFLDGRHACYVAFVPSGASSGSVFLVDDAGDAGGPYQGLVLPGSGSVSNSQCTIAGAGSSVSGNGNYLTLTLAISFSQSFAGNKVVYLAARDANNSGWQALGVWQVPGAAQTTTAAVIGMAPTGGTGTVGTPFIFTFSDTKG